MQEKYLKWWKQPKITYEQIKLLTKNTIRRLKQVLGDNKYQSIGLAWSGGKDSIVLSHLLDNHQIYYDKSIIALYHYQYPSFERWIRDKKNQPRNLEFSKMVGVDTRKLNNDQKFLFPETKKETSYAYTKDRWNIQKKFALENNLDVMLYGRRNQDRNNTGVNGLLKHKDFDRYSPIYDWTNEELMAYIHYNNIELPEIYLYHDGFELGTEPWTSKRLVNDLKQTFDIVLSDEKEAIEIAVRLGLNKAIEYMEELK